jgi:hypothetical protein
VQHAYVAIHAAYHRALFVRTPSPTLAAADDLLASLVQWSSTAVHSPAYAALHQHARHSRRNRSTHKRQRVALDAGARDQVEVVVDSDAEDELHVAPAGADSLLPPTVGAFTLSPSAALRHVIDWAMSTPPLGHRLLQSCLDAEHQIERTEQSLSAPATSDTDLTATRLKRLYEMAVQAHGSTSPRLWMAYLCWTRSKAASSPSSSQHASSSAWSGAWVTLANQLLARAKPALQSTYHAEFDRLCAQLVR